MTRSTLNRCLGAVVAALVFLVAGQEAVAGPPLLCWQIETGDARCLPWGNAPFDEVRGYSAAAVADDTLALLDDDQPVLIRMEILRRAAIYLKDDAPRARDLLGRLMARAMDAEATGQPKVLAALAWFDAGYLLQAYHQWNSDFTRGMPGAAGPDRSGVAGYAWVKRGIELRGDDPAMELAAALMTAMHDRSASAVHLKRAARGRGTDPLLAANLLVLAPTIRQFIEPRRR